MMDASTDLNELKDQILHLKSSAEALKTTGKDIPAIARNIARILASVKMLELNVVDAADLSPGD